MILPALPVMDHASRDTVFESNRVTLAVSADDAPEFLQTHGFFYQENAAIGAEVDRLFRTGAAKNRDFDLAHFKPFLERDLVSLPSSSLLRY